MPTLDRAACLAGALFLAGLASPARAQIFEAFPTPTQPSNPFGITVGPDGNLWFVETTFSRIGRITPDGDITEFPSGAQGAADITTGPDGNLWFLHHGGVGRVTTAGVVTLFATPTPPGGGLITAGPDGNLWFTETEGNRIGRVTPAGQVTEFILPRPSTRPLGITAGPDGNLWFTERGYRSIGRITLAGAITEFAAPGVGWQIVAGPDGDLWYTDEDNARITTVSTSGSVVRHFYMTVKAQPQGLTVGSDGFVWFAATFQNWIGSVAPVRGWITNYAVPPPFAGIREIVEGPDGSIWFTMQSVSSIGRMRAW